MKYYCTNCGTEVVIGEGINTQGLFEDGMICPFNTDHGEMVEIPDYETPAQYKARTGKPYPDDGLVFFRQVFDGEVGKWNFGAYLNAVAFWATEGVDEIVIADPPVPPADDRRSE